MVKKQAFVVLITFMSIVGSAFGLGLGDIDVKSNLNDPLDAEIKLIQLQGLTAGEVLPTLASNDDFRRAGVERSFFLSNIQFRVKETDSGDVVVTLTTRQVVREPFLNFLVEVNWPGGRLLKEYTVLLDPPVFDTGLAVDALIVEPASNANATNVVSTTVVEDGKTTETAAAIVPVQPRDDSLASDQYRVKRNDTLWEIALKVPERSGYTPQQVMLAIQDLNPEAFLKGNINRVKAGSVLTLPDAAQISARSFDQAIQEVTAQNNGAGPSLRSPVSQSSEVQLSATETTSSALPTNDGDKNPDGYLELTSDSQSDSTTASGDVTADVDRLQNQLSATQELNDQYLRERDELESRVEELQEQIEIMERLVNVQNSDLAQVQEALGQTADAAAAAEVETPAVETPAVETPVVEDTAAATPAVTQPAVQPITTPAPVQQAPQSTVDQILGFVTDISGKASNWVMSSTTNMAIAGGGLLLLILLPLYLRSRNSNGNKTLSEMTNGEEMDDFDEIEDFDADLDDDLLAEVEDEFEEEDEEPETIDAVVEAEMYMAYQKYDQAEEKLKEAFSEYPDRADVGIKLLEVYAETGDVNAFSDLEGRLTFTADQQEEVSALREKLPVGGNSDNFQSDSLTDDLSLDIGGDDDFNAPDSLGSDLDFDIDLDGDDEPAVATDDDLDLDLGMDLETSEPEEALDFSLDLGDDTSSDLDLNLDEDVETAEEESTDLDFSLDLGDLDNDGDISPEISLDGLEDEALDLDFSSEEPEPEIKSALDFSLDMDEDTTSDETEGGLDLDMDLGSLDIESDFEENDDGLSLDTGASLDFESEDSGISLELDDDDSGISLELEEDDAGDIDLAAELAALGEASAELDSSDDFTMELETESLSSLDNEPEVDQLQQLSDSLESDAELEEDEFDFLSGSDEASTKLDLARAYIEMDDRDGARDILEEVASEGTDDQKNQARELIGQL